ncbi:TonB-dependent receptor [Flavihumibacter sp. CACIAM 22H1]|uniref:SusC/RagA family TonB-linked outer membrane protein n=1 Tax=Flavihumibacter sp. CACIAM 22H1 TaxID=1812911 RepID=UPI0025B83FE4|nr:TonB-dependent receptor [Flavihumibacter sp. CACIAM 22H1]
MKNNTRNMLVKASGTLLALLICVGLYAQQAVTGTIRSVNGEPLGGATVKVKGTQKTVIADASGAFSIEAGIGSFLVISYVGYQDQEVKVTGESLTISLTSTASLADEVVVIGYQSVRKKDLTGAVGVIDPGTANKNTSNSVAESIQGLTPGVTVRNTGQPGGGAKIDIRGAGTFANNNPLYIIDGMYSDATPDFNPADIETIQILKDASAAAIYGSRAANGVIIITTKKGKKGPPSFSGSIKAGIQGVHNRYDMMNAQEYRTLATQLHEAGGLPVPTSISTEFDPSINTDWQKEFLRTGAIGDYNLSASGSLKKLNYFISANHFNNKGPVIDNSFSRTGFRINTNIRHGRFNIGENVLFSWTKEDPIASSGVGVNPFVDMISMPPVVALRGSRYESAENPEGWGIGLNNAYLNTLTANVPALQRLDQFEQRNFKIRGNAFVEFTIADGFFYKFNFGIEKTMDRGDGIRMPGTVRQGTPSPNNNEIGRFRSRGEFQSTLLEHTLNYDKVIGDHRIGAVAGVSMQRFDHPVDRINQIGSNPEVLDRYKEISNFIGYLGRVNYSYQDKYLTSLTFRRDGSSKFSNNNRWGNFPSASVAWRISKEKFWNVDAVNDLKIRASYGSLGNAEFLNAWMYYAVINPFPRAVFGPNSTEQVGAIVTQLANTDLRWERKNTTNLGIEASFLNNALSFSADYFIAKTKDVLVDLPISLTTGNAGGNPAVNAASIQNKGIELALTYRSKRTANFKWDATVNFTRIRNKVLAFGNESTKYTQIGDARTELGRSIGEWYVLKTDGIFQSQAEVDAHRGKTGELLQPWARPGDIRYVDVDDDGTLDLDKDRHYAGSPWADWESGLILNMQYKQFSFSMQWYAVVGNQLYNRPRYTVDRMDLNTNFRKGANFWTPENQSNEWPRAAIGAPDQGIQYNVLPQSDRWLENGSYLRLRNIEVAYNIPQTSLQRIGFKSASVYLSGQNLLTLTNYTGLDPDIVGVNIFERGLDNGQYPALRMVSAGLRFTY